jgi:hypothetical protein
MAQALQAARLMGAAQALRESVGSPASVDAVYEHEAAALRNVLGQAEFDRAFHIGRSSPWENTVAFVSGQNSG